MELTDKEKELINLLRSLKGQPIEPTTHMQLAIIDVVKYIMGAKDEQSPKAT